MLQTIDSEPADIPSGTVTFLFTDIEGSTKLLERLREQYASLLEDQRDLLRQAFARWNGHEIDTQGDAFFVAFSRALDAVNCVVEAQRFLAGHQWPQGVRLSVRMGLHTGEPVIGRTGYVGMDVHRAARIASAGHGGQVLVSQTTRDLIYQDIPQEVSLVDLGEYKLKDIRYPQRIYQLEITGLPSEFPPLKTLSTAETPPTPGEAPYKGLMYFDEPDAEWFFGREAVTARLVEAVQSQRFLAVIGASGSGKSSVVRAGLVPSLKHTQPGRWQVFMLTPTAHPLEALAVSLTRQAESVTATATLIDDLERDSRTLHLYVQKALSLSSSPYQGESRGEGRILLVIDQFEELFTQCREPAERQEFVANLLYAVQVESGSTRVVITLRADFYEHVAQFPELREAVASQQIYIGTMSAEELRQAIEEPARRGGWELSPGLADLILHDVGAGENRHPEPGALPLLSHALLETWKRRRGNLLNLRAYTEAGGVRRAIAHTADHVYTQELTPNQQEIARGIFLRLTELGEGAQDTRRRISIHELLPPGPAGDTEQIQAVLVKLADARLITTSEATVEIAHEALIREWPTLREWLSQDREGLRLHRQLTEAAYEWDLLERDPGALYRGIRLANALEWALNNPRQLNSQEQVFISESKEVAEKEEAEREAARQRELEAAQKLAETEHQRAEDQSRAAKNLRRRAIYLSVAVAAIAILAGLAFFLAQQSNRNARLASARELAAASLASLQTDPERSILLALEAIKKEPLREAQNAVHQAIYTSHLRDRQTGHEGYIYGAAISPSGDRLATAGMDGTLKVWPVQASAIGDQPIMVTETGIDYDVGLLASGSTLDFSPDGSQIATFGPDFTIILLDASSGEVVQTFSGHSDASTSLAFSPDGKHLASSSTDGTVRIWDWETGKELWKNESPVRMVAFSPNGQFLATGGEDSTVGLWRLEGDGKPFAITQVASWPIENEHSVDAVAFSPDSMRLATSTLFSNRVWDLEDLQTGKAPEGFTSPPLMMKTPGEAGWVNALFFSPDGARLATATATGSIKWWDATTGQELMQLLPASPVLSGALSPDGKTLVVVGEQGKIDSYNVSSLGNPEWFSLAGNFAHLSSDGQHALVENIQDNEMGVETISLWELGEGEPKKVSEFTAILGSPSVDSFVAQDFKHFAQVGENNQIKIWDISSGELLNSLLLDGEPGNIYSVDPNVNFSQWLTGGTNGKISLWDGTTGEEISSFQAEDGQTLAKFSQDGKRILSMAENSTSAHLWDTATGKLIQEFKGHTARIVGAHVLPDEKRVATSSIDGTVKIWDIDSGQELHSFGDFPAQNFAIQISLDGRLLAVYLGNRRTLIYNLENGEEIYDLPGFYANFTPDGRRLLLGSRVEDTIYGFHLDLEELLEVARSRVTRSLTSAECQRYLHLKACPERGTQS